MNTEAAVHTAPNGRLAVETVSLDAPRRGEVLVRMLASGVCHTDLHVVQGDWDVPLPLVLGHEGTGIVEQIGPEVEDVAVGDHVVLSWFAPCRRCSYCVTGRPWACTTSQADYCVMADGTSRLSRAGGDPLFPFLAVGSFARHAVVPESGAIPMPAGLPPEVAALIGCGVTTGVGAVLNTARAAPGLSAAVVGCGGVGLSAVMGLRLAGAHPIIAVDLSADRLKVAGELGATHLIDAREDVVQAVREIDEWGAEYVIEAHGSPETVALAVRATRRGGTTVLVGLPPTGVTAPLDVLNLANRGKSVIGCAYGSSVPAVDFPRIADLYLAGQLPTDRLITDEIELDAVNDALDAMRARKRVRSVVTFD